MQTVLTAILSLSLLGLLAGMLLAYASKVFAVKTDPKLQELINALPGANCGACGETGCPAFAEALLKGKQIPYHCYMGGEKTAKEIARILGIQMQAKTAQVALILCGANQGLCEEKFEYNGIPDCRANSALAGGAKACSYGCLALGTCKQYCKFNAINPNGKDIPEMNHKDNCTGCKLCLKPCPRSIIEMVPRTAQYVVFCNSKDPGDVTRKICKVGCIACSLCVNACPTDAIVITDNLAKINYAKCINCGECSRVCPQNTIQKVNW